MTYDNRTVDKLKTVKQHLERHNWAQGDAALAANSTCLGIALNTLGYDTDAVDYIYEAIAEKYGELYRHGAGIIVYWNDQPGRTKEEVLAVVDRAVELAAARPEYPPEQIP
jgi:hypothetical protein